MDFKPIFVGIIMELDTLIKMEFHIISQAPEVMKNCLVILNKKQSQFTDF